MRRFNRPCLALLILILFLATPGLVFAGNRKLMSIQAAKTLASRALAEMVGGLSLVSSATVTDLGEGLPDIRDEGRTSAHLAGVKYDEIAYDAQRDIAKVTASVVIDSIRTPAGQEIPLNHEKITRVAFATSTPANAGPLQALRAAELDAYRKMGQQIMGFDLESKTTVANLIMVSDEVRTRTVATLYLARITGYSWDEEGNAHVRMTMDPDDASALLGEKIVAEAGAIEVEGVGAQSDDTTAAMPAPVPVPVPTAMPVSMEMKTAVPKPAGLTAPLLPVALPRAAAGNPSGIAVIIGNRDYAKAGKDVPDIAYAKRDADAVYQYVTTTLGFLPGNVIRFDNATQGDLIATFGSKNDPHGKLMDWTKPGKSDVFIYYSGHGAPSLTSGKGYLLPVDAYPDKVELNGYSLDLFYENLAQIKARSMTVVIDACFSGSSGGGSVVKSASSIALRTVASKAPTATTVISAAGDSEVASWDNEQGHGLFTLHLLEGLAGKADQSEYGNGDRQVSLAELGRYLGEEVTYDARRLYGREQHAQVSGNAETILTRLPK